MPSQPITVNDGAGSAVSAMTTADLRGMKKRDLLVSTVNGTAMTSVLLGNGDGTFAAAKAFGTGPAHSFAIADYNHDMHEDVVYVDQQKNGLGIFLGTGDGTLTAGAWKSDSYSGAADQALARNLFGAGSDDVLLSMGNGTLAFRNFADGGFDAPNRVQVNWTMGQSFTALEGTDLNGDGRVDAVFVISNGQIGTMLGNADGAGKGDGTFSGLTIYTPQQWSAMGAVVRDFDGDGHGDVVTMDKAVSDGGTTVLLGQGNGAGAVTTPFRSVASGWPNGVTNWQFAAGDVNHDSAPDLVLLSADAHVSILLGDGLGSFTAGPLMALSALGDAGPVQANQIVVDDLNGDGKADVVIGAGTAAGHAAIFVLMSQ
jgi:hypothetical protein